MHMADALVSPPVGGALWAVAAGAVSFSSVRLQKSLDDKQVPMMGVLAAFVFAVQMINFSIPGTGSSGHLGGGMLLAILLGPAAGFVAMASVLTVQALFFADGGLLALGCNVINLGVTTCFIAYPLVFRPLAGAMPTQLRLSVACVLASLVGLQLGAFGVVAETILSGRSELPFGPFLLLMQPVHFAIGLIEGLVTALVVNLLRRSHPDLIPLKSRTPQDILVPRSVLATLLAVAIVCGGFLSGFASSRPDGLEWALERAAAEGYGIGDELQHEPGMLSRLQQRISLLPGYQFPVADPSEGNGPVGAVNNGTALSGLAGGAITLVVVLLGAGVTRLLMKRRGVVLSGPLPGEGRES